MPLNPEEIQQVRLTLETSGWKVMEKVIANRTHDAIRALVLSPSERTGETKEMTDETIRARVREGEWMLFVWRNEIRLHDLERAQQQMLMNELHQQPTDGPAGPGRDPLTPANP